MTLKDKRNKWLIFALQVLVIIVTYFPIYFMLISSLKTNDQIIANYFLPSLPIHLENYVSAFQKVIYYLWNSVVISSGTAMGVLLFGMLTSYVFARFDFPGKEGIFMLLLAFSMIPGILTLIPMFVLVNNLGLVNSRWSCILPYIATGQIMFILIMRTFIEEIPRDLFDAAKIDGAGNLKIFSTVIFPLARPIIVSLLLLNFLNSWNDFIWPLLTLSQEKMKTVTVGLYAFTDVQQIQYGNMFAGFVIASVPLVILFAMNMKYFVSGITLGAVKG